MPQAPRSGAMENQPLNFPARFSLHALATKALTELARL